MTNEEVLAVLSDLDKDVYEVDIIEDSWYSPKSFLRAMGGSASSELSTQYPEVAAVRVYLKNHSGMLELHPHSEDNLITIKCYCCFEGGDAYKKGEYPLEALRDAVISLKDHHCPPWPG